MFRLIQSPIIKYRKSIFQAHVAIVGDQFEVDQMIREIDADEKYKHTTYRPYAYRLSIDADEDNPETTPGVVEGAEDHKEVGASDKMLHLLKKWDVENVLLIVTRQDRSLCGDVVGMQKYKYILECCKAALENCFMGHLDANENARLAIQECDGGEQVPAPAPATSQVKTCLLSPETVKFPKGHIPTADGGKKGVKQGRVNHFLHDEQAQKVEQHKRHIEQKNFEVKYEVQEERTEDDEGNIEEDEALETITMTDIRALKSFRKPIKEIHLVLVCVAFLLDHQDISWEGCRELLVEPSLLSRIEELDVTTMDKKQITSVRAILQAPELAPDAVERKSKAAAKILSWVNEFLHQYDLHILNLRPSKAQEIIATIEKKQPQLKKPILLEMHAPEAPAPPTKDYSNVCTLPHDRLVATKTKIVDRGRMYR